MRTRERFFCRAGAVACALAVVAGEGRAAVAERGDPVLEEVRKYRAETWRWQRLTGASLTLARPRSERPPTPGFRRRALAFWRTESARARHAAFNPPRLAAWLCIHEHEGPWNANTGNGYYGGLQMDLAFQRAYGADLLRAKGPAHRWRPLEQIWVAERAYRSGVGFSAWPNAAGACGLA
jgi:hypothetical protein